MTYDTIIDQSESSLAGVALLGNVLITKDANTPSGDPVIVDGGTGANIAAVSSFTVANGATFNPGSLLGATVGSTYYIDGGTLDINSLVGVSALNTFTFTPNGGKIVVSPGVNVNLNLPVTGWSSQSLVDFPGAASVVATDSGGNTILTALNGLGLGTGQSLTISGDIFGLALGASTTINSTDGAGGILVCFLEGTEVEVAQGSVPVETIRVHDCVVTVTSGVRTLSRVVWVGNKTVDLDAAPTGEDRAPIRIRRDAIADGVPRRDLMVTGDHGLFFDGVLVPARTLVNGRSIVRDTTLRRFTIFHIETENHSILLAEGALSESYLDTGNRASFSGKGVRVVSPTTSKSWAKDAAAPLAVNPSILGPLWARLDDRATQRGYSARESAALTMDPDLRLVDVSGRILRPQRKDGDRYFFRLPADITEVSLVSRSARPCDVHGPFVDDRRVLGVCVGQVGLWLGHLRSPYGRHLSGGSFVGWHEPEGPSARWTDGCGQLSFELTDTGALTLLEVQVVAGGPYPGPSSGDMFEAA